MSLLYYLAEANLYLGVLYILYLLVLRNETFYQLNRAWLLGATVLAFVIPFLQLGFLKPQVETSQLAGYTITGNIQALNAGATANHYNWYVIVYSAIALLMFAVFLLKVLSLVSLSRKSGVKQLDQYKLVETGDSNAFSFFNYLFIGRQLSISSTVVRHELIHIQQKHGYDVVWFELVKAVCWFNPLVYLMQNSLKELHEFIADRETSALENGADMYTSFLIDNAYGLAGNSVTNTFFNSNQLKKRIMMLHQKPSGRSARLKYLLAVPLCGGLLCVSTLGITKTYGWVDIAPHRAVKINDNSRQATLAVADTPKVVLDVKPSKKLSMNAKPVVHNDVQHTETRVDFDRPKHLPRTSKGYEYFETGYLVNGKGDIRVIIKEKNKDEIVFWRSGASDAVKKMLNDKYGYTFPSMAIYPKMPPPPPAPPKIVADKADPVKIAPPPPPAKPADKISRHKLPPPPPAPPADKVDVKTPPPPPPAKPNDKKNAKATPVMPSVEALLGVVKNGIKRC